MKFKYLLYTMSSVMAASFLIGCGQTKTEITNENASTILEALLEDVSFDTELSMVEKNTQLYFPDLPEGTTIALYTGSGYFADEVAMFTLVDKADGDETVKVIENHVEELRNQFVNYVPEEVGKIDDAIVYQSGNYIFLCITDDTETANEILENKGSVKPDNGETEETKETKESKEETTESDVKESDTEDSETEETTEGSVETEYPKLQSQSGTYHDYGADTIRVDNSAFELYTYIDASAGVYADILNDVAEQLSGKTTVYSMVIPTATGVVLPDDIAEMLTGYSDQGESIEKINQKMSDKIVKIDCFDNLMKHRDEYIYFRSDFHWNGTGAYYAYESFCEAKNLEAISLDQREEKRFDGFLGGLYWNNCEEDELLSEHPDTVIAYLPKSTTAKMEYTDIEGNTKPWNIIVDVTDWKASKKYSTFAGADNPIAVFTNPEVTDGSVCVVVKESFGNALMSYLVDHYSVIYEIDYRYWEGNLIDFVNEKNADDLIFANNVMMMTSNYLIGKLNGIIE